MLRLCVHTRTRAHTLEGELFSATPGGAQGRLLAGSKLKDLVLGGTRGDSGWWPGTDGGMDGWMEPGASALLAAPWFLPPDADRRRCQIS